MVWESLLTLSGGGRVPWSWSSFFPGGDDVPAPLQEGNSGRVMVEVGDGKKIKQLCLFSVGPQITKFVITVNLLRKEGRTKQKRQTLEFGPNK